MATNLPECLSCVARPVCVLESSNGSRCRDVAALVVKKFTASNTQSKPCRHVWTFDAKVGIGHYCALCGECDD
jgi:hypothetical protein